MKASKKMKLKEVLKMGLQIVEFDNSKNSEKHCLHFNDLEVEPLSVIK